MAHDMKPGRGSERIKAWVYAIINPLIDSFRRETELLKSGNLSWRIHSRRCEYIRPIPEVINPDHEPILDDFLAEYSTFRARFDERDSALGTTEQAATRFVQGLLQGSEFRRQVDVCLRNYESMRATHPTYPELVGHLGERAAEYIAEFLVNNVQSMPRHYAHHAFWEAFRLEFEAFKQRETFTKLTEAANRLRNLSQQLGVDLGSLRLDLCREYDIPAAPIESPRSLSSENVLFR
jgi:hypothetical protein